FNRRARMLLPLMRCIRQDWNQEVKTAGEFLIIDSFPVPVWQPVRNYRVKIFRGIADIGYKATKKIYYYGFKVHALVSDDGYVLDYAVTRASVHDAKETVELMINAHPINHYLLGDEGYLGKDLAAELKGMGYVLWTPYRRNMECAKKHNDHQLMAIRRTIESDFSLLSYYNAENNRARSLAGFQQRLEIAILAYNMAYCLERFN
ncbi:IS982 family transposase, partial [Lactobacillus crispatus]